MLWNEAKILKNTEFKRQTFNKMVEILIESEIIQKK